MPPRDEIVDYVVSLVKEMKNTSLVEACIKRERFNQRELALYLESKKGLGETNKPVRQA